MSDPSGHNTESPLEAPLSPDRSTFAEAWAQHRRPLFRELWMANLFSNIGTWMQTVAAAWLMTSLSHSTLMIALVQTATSLPVFLLVLPAGALADNEIGGGRLKLQRGGRLRWRRN